jgi:hypothetical protein
MKNTINIGRQPETISPHELADAMQAGRAYSQEEVMGLLPGRPRACVRDTLHLMVQMSEAAIFHALNDARTDVLAMHDLVSDLFKIAKRYVHPCDALTFEEQWKRRTA